MLLAACSDVDATTARDGFVIDALARDNYVYALRDPALVAMKLTKMQEAPFVWLRGTAAVFWRDIMTPGIDRPAMTFGDPASSRVLLVGDPHPENLGTYRAGDGSMLVDWDDFDAAGYGPYEGDVRRLAAGMIIAAPSADPDAVARAVAQGYAEQIAALAAGQPVVAVGPGAEPYLDDLMTKAHEHGDAQETLNEVAPVVGGARAIAFGDIDPPDAQGVIADRLEPVGPDAAVAIDAAIASWRTTTEPPLDPAFATIKLRARRLGAGVSSYAVPRYYAVLEGATASLDDDRVVELKEEHDGLVLAGVPQYAFAEWQTPAARVVDAQRRMCVRPDVDVLLGAGDQPPLSLRVHEETDYQKGVSADDLAALPSDQLLSLAHRFGAMLARGHGQSLTADDTLGYTAIAPRLADAAGFADEIAALATADATQILADYDRFKSRDLAALVLPLTGAR